MSELKAIVVNAKALSVDFEYFNLDAFRCPQRYFLNSYSCQLGFNEGCLKCLFEVFVLVEFIAIEEFAEFVAVEVANSLEIG